MSIYSVELISGLTPKNNGNFPLVRAHDVEVEEGVRVDQRLPFYCTTLPTANAEYFMRTAVHYSEGTSTPYICLYRENNGVGEYYWAQYNDVAPIPAESLRDLGDVQIANLRDGDTLQYDSSSNKWKNVQGGEFCCLTKDEYDALPDSKLSNGVVYLISEYENDFNF